MKAGLYYRIAKLARERGLSFYEAAARFGRLGAQRRRRKPTENERLTAVRATWAWKRDFE